MLPFRFALLILGTLPALAEVTLTNATTHRVRLKITSIAAQGRDLTVASYASAAPPKARPAWGAEDKGAVHEPTFHGTYQDLAPRPINTLILYLTPGGQAVFTPSPCAPGAVGIQQVDLLLSLHGLDEGAGVDLPVRYRALALGGDVASESLHLETTQENKADGNPVPLELVAPDDKHPDYRIKVPKSAPCVIL
ncbi:hypothetical protein [Geothrix sp. 21YS21S-2]|uniref:hypothetical protein n=1 Tax=Geothrix sp. 21YS21S-2 TaxID=3068893 RepID=UPI0027BA771D|nr:hypothetical protein [Geothrix sp. 21YS21S-2]